MSGTPTFDDNPPIVELVLGVQFSPLVKLSAGHFGLFWKEIGPEWISPSDEPLLDDHFERFDRQRMVHPTKFNLRLEPLRLPGRFLIAHKCEDRLIQFQATRFHFNWRKREQFYPSYKKLITEFEAMFERFSAFVEQTGLGPLAPNQWELTYIDSFPKQQYWESQADWPKVLPGLFGELFPTDGLDLSLEHRGAEWSYEIKPQLGRLHIVGKLGRWGDEEQDSLLLQMTARGPIGKGGVATLREGLDIGHNAAVGTFLRVTNKDLHRQWGGKQ